MYKLILTYLPYAFVLILVGSFVLPCRLKTRAQAIWCMLLLACASKFVCFEAFGGDAFAPELPEKFIWFWNWAYSGMCLLVPLSLVWLVVTRRRRPRLGLYILPLIAWSLSARGLYNGIKVPDLVEREIVCENLPASLDGYTVLQLSDLHVSAAARKWRTEAAVAKANDVGADLIVVTGDLVDGHPVRQARNLEPIRELKAKDGVLFCDGNHEYYFDYAGWHRTFDRWGLRFLRNEWTSPRPGLVVAGVTDTACRSKGGSFPPDVDQSFDGAPEDAFRLLLQHRPSINWEKCGLTTPEARFDLQLSGHTHGGVAPILNALVRHANAGLLRGLYGDAGGIRVHVSPGTGQWAGFPIRFFDDPEITLLRLRCKKE